MTRLYTAEYDDFEQFLRNAIKDQNARLSDSKNLFKLTEIQYFTINLNAWMLAKWVIL
jgi:hypothetical protein